MMNIKIYQIDMDRDTNRIAFINYESINQFQGSPNVDGSIYDRVYSGEVDCNNLEDVYAMFNLNRPSGYKGRSLSVSDVVEVIDSVETEPSFYFCDDVGFKKIDFEPDNSVKESLMTVVLLKPGEKAQITQIDSTLGGMQAVVSGDIEAVYPFEEEVCIVCNEEGKIIGQQMNRALYMPPEDTEFSFEEMCGRFRDKERDGSGAHISGFVVFSEDSFNEKYSEESRTYEISSNNKAFQPNMGGYSIYGSAVDGSDPCVRLEQCIRGENPWKIERCYMKGSEREMFDIVAGTAFICDCSGENFGSLTDEQAKRYEKEFHYPEAFIKVNNEIISIPVKETKTHEER